MGEIIPIVDEGLGNSSYLVDLGDASALVVDPSRDPRPYLGLAESRGCRIRFAAETHLHADFVSGARELAQAHDAQILAPAAAELAFPCRGLIGGQELDLGGLRLRALATPGHTPEHLSYLLLEDGAPVAVFTGGSLMVGGVARTDLLTPDQTRPLALAAWRSLQDCLLALPDDLTVYPTHGGGSFCAAAPEGERVTTIGAERRGNPLLQATGEKDFVRRLLDSLGSYPGYFLRLRDHNRQGPKVYGRDTPPLAPLDPDDVQGLLDAGAVLVDARPVDRFAAGHVPGALAIELRGHFGTWIGWLVDDPATPLLFVADPEQDRDDLVRQCLKVGYENLRGELAGGVAAWERADRPLSRIDLVDAAASRDATILDVRQAAEWQDGHIPGAIHCELGALPDAADGLPDGPLVVHCVHGQRSMTAASVLGAQGRGDVSVYPGGPQDWADAAADRPEPVG